MTESVDVSAERIFAWLREHAPATAATVNPPTSPAALDAAEREVGAAFPEDVRRWYLRADGMRWIGPWRGTLIPAWFRPYPLAMALDIRRMMLGVAAQFPPDDPLSPVAGDASELWQPLFLPVAADTGSVTLFVDLRTGEQHGCVVEYDKVGACEAPATWPSVSGMLADVAAALVNDGVADGCRPEVDEAGCLQWRLPEGLWPARGRIHTGELARGFAALLDHAAAPDLADPALAATIVARVARVVDALLDSGAHAMAGSSARYDDPDPNDGAALRAYVAGHGGLDGVRRHLTDAGERLVAMCGPYHEDYGTPHRANRPPLLPATIRERGDIVVDATQSWPDLVGGLGWLLHSSARRVAELRPRAPRPANRAIEHFNR
ncbi:SMI1/KNR4 family protein [Dactylosporangium sp. NPDC051541]|uniref:SMI1/KNR4 family protein n=1 Tax=Dactylosporangium sp. NPDC051541 TaxID=3363977 RepID=UPI00378793B9